MHLEDTVLREVSQSQRGTNTARCHSCEVPNANAQRQKAAGGARGWGRGTGSVRGDEKVRRRLALRCERTQCQTAHTGRVTTVAFAAYEHHEVSGSLVALLRCRRSRAGKRPGRGGFRGSQVTLRCSQVGSPVPAGFRCAPPLLSGVRWPDQRSPPPPGTVLTSGSCLF